MGNDNVGVNLEQLGNGGPLLLEDARRHEPTFVTARTRSFSSSGNTSWPATSECKVWLVGAAPFTPPSSRLPPDRAIACAIRPVVQFAT